MPSCLFFWQGPAREMQTLDPSIFFSNLVSSSVKTVLPIAVKGVVNNIVVRSRDRLPWHPHPCVMPAQDVLSSQRRQNCCNCAKYDKPQNKIVHDICYLNSETWAAALWVWQTCRVCVSFWTLNMKVNYVWTGSCIRGFPSHHSLSPSWSRSGDGCGRAPVTLALVTPLLQWWAQDAPGFAGSLSPLRDHLLTKSGQEISA